MAAEPLISPGTGSFIQTGTSLLTGLVSSYFNDKALSKQNKILSKERKRQLSLDKSNLAFQKSQSAFANRMARQQFSLGKKTQEFNMGQTNRQNRIDDFQRMMNGIVQRMQTDNAVRDQFVQRGYI